MDDVDHLFHWMMEAQLNVIPTLNISAAQNGVIVEAQTNIVIVQIVWLMWLCVIVVRLPWARVVLKCGRVSRDVGSTAPLLCRPVWCGPPPMCPGS